MKIGYIARRTGENGKETFFYREANGTRRIGARSDTVKVYFLCGTTPYEEIEINTKMLENKNIMLVQEPFITNEEMKERCEKWIAWANACDNREYSFFGEVSE